MTDASAQPAMIDDAAPPRVRLLGISGSLRADAYSTAVLRALATAEPRVTFDYGDIGALPHFNQDQYVEPLPPAVARLRRQIADADGLVVVSPEYNHGIPGVLKNAIDWLSRPHNGSPLRGKPVLIVTASHAFTGGVRAQYQIREALVAVLARPVATPELVIGQVNTKVVDGRFDDATTLSFARTGFDALHEEIARSRSS